MKRIIKWLIALYYKCKYAGKCRIHATSDTIMHQCSFEGKNSVGKRTYLFHTQMGYGSYIGHNSEFSNCKIGRFCSIGTNVRVVSANHPVSGFVSSHPAFYSDSFSFSYVKKSKFTEHIVTENGNECEIGSDVWIGDNVLIKGGIKIGDGAVIGMGSIVTHDVPPYAIVAGVPAVIIRKRYDDETIKSLLDLSWWMKSPEWIANHADEFADIQSFLQNNSVQNQQ